MLISMLLLDSTTSLTIQIPDKTNITTPKNSPAKFSINRRAILEYRKPNKHAPSTFPSRKLPMEVGCHHRYPRHHFWTWILFVVVSVEKGATTIFRNHDIKLVS